MPVIATAAWSLPKSFADRFPQAGSGLARYAAVFDGVEVNSTFYRQHRPSTFERWAATVPETFRFALKLPREITHTLRLKSIGPAFGAFLEGAKPLGGKLGPLICQLPPSLPFDAELAGTAFSTIRHRHSGPFVLEARHPSWAAEEALELLESHDIDRVLADPAPVWPVADFSSAPAYVRLHGSPKMYYSSYPDEEIRAFYRLLDDKSWCVFDNTASGAAIQNALAMLDIGKLKEA